MGCNRSRAIDIEDSRGFELPKILPSIQKMNLRFRINFPDLYHYYHSIGKTLSVDQRMKLTQYYYHTDWVRAGCTPAHARNRIKYIYQYSIIMTALNTLFTWSADNSSKTLRCSVILSEEVLVYSKFIHLHFIGCTNDMFTSMDKLAKKINGNSASDKHLPCNYERDIVHAHNLCKILLSQCSTNDANSSASSSASASVSK